jgi:hypothetical protein
LQEIKDTDNKSSKTKRKYSIFASESHCDKEIFLKLKSKLEACYSLYEESNEKCIVNFKDDILNNQFELDEASFIPKSRSSPASKILTLEIFWVLLIESVKQAHNELSIQNLIDLFNESFKNVNEESLIKSYYLKTVKQIDNTKMKQYLESQGKLLNYSSCLTNDVYFGLLDSFVQFLLRSKEKRLNDKNSSEEKKTKKNIHKENISACQDIDLMISSKLKREFLHTEISQNENFVYSKTKISRNYFY